MASVKPAAQFGIIELPRLVFPLSGFKDFLSIEVKNGQEKEG
jgi:hypothetical protein